MVTGWIELNNRHDEIIVISIVSRKTPHSITLKKRGVTKLEFLLTINYSNPIRKEDFEANKNYAEHSAIESMKKALQEAQHADSDNIYYNFKREHMQAWRNLWSTGFEISASLAENSVNGSLYFCRGRYNIRAS